MNDFVVQEGVKQNGTQNGFVERTARKAGAYIKEIALNILRNAILEDGLLRLRKERYPGWDKDGLIEQAHEEWGKNVIIEPIEMTSQKTGIEETTGIFLRLNQGFIESTRGKNREEILKLVRNHLKHGFELADDNQVTIDISGEPYRSANIRLDLDVIADLTGKTRNEAIIFNGCSRLADVNAGLLDRSCIDFNRGNPWAKASDMEKLFPDFSREDLIKKGILEGNTQIREEFMNRSVTKVTYEEVNVAKLKDITGAGQVLGK